jgi:hypothetical protein
MTDEQRARIGRPPLPESERRTGRIHLRTYPDVEEIFKRMGTEELERVIRAWAKRQEKR